MKIDHKLIKNDIKHLKHIFLMFKTVTKDKTLKKVYKVCYMILKNDLRLLNKNLIDLNNVKYDLKDIKAYLMDYNINNPLINCFLSEINNYIVLYYKQFDNML